MISVDFKGKKRITTPQETLKEVQADIDNVEDIIVITSAGDKEGTIHFYYSSMSTAHFFGLMEMVKMKEFDSIENEED